MGNQTGLSVEKRDKPDKKVRTVVYADELPVGVLRWLERKFKAQEIPELVDAARNLISIKRELESLKAKQELDEFEDMING